jgi:hypothetical protein
VSVGAVAGVLLLIVVPGVPAAFAVGRPGRIDVVTRVAMVPVLGTVVAGAVAFVLTLGGVLSAATFFAALGLATAALTVVVVRRHGLRAHVRATAEAARGDAWALLLGILAIVAIGVVRWSFTPDVHFSAASAWRYWADAVEIADAGGVPNLSLQYGSGLVPTVSKVFLNAFNAGVCYAVGRDALPALGALLWAGSVSLGLAVWALGRELGLRWTAPLLALLLVVNRTFLNPEITTDLDAYRAETFGRLVAAGGLALALHAIRNRDGWTLPLVAGATLGVAAGMHVVPVIVCGILGASYGVALLIREGDRRARVVRGAVMAGVAVTVAGAILVLPSGDVGLSGAAGDDVYARFGSEFDPTLFVNAGVTPEEQAAAEPRDWTLSPGRAWRALTASAAGEKSTEGLRPRDPPSYVDGLGVVLAIGFIVGAAALLLWFPPRLRPLGLMAAGLAFGMAALTWWFSRRSSLFIPANFGLRRLYDYSAVPVVLLGLGLVEGAVALSSRAHRWAPAALAAALVVAAGAWLVPGARLHPGRVDRARPVIAPMRWVAANLPCDARILANQHSEGFFQAGLGRVAVLEGMTPYLRPEVLEEKIELFLDARAFFESPTRAFVDGLGVTHVITVRGGGVGYPAMLGRTGSDALDRARFLRVVHQTPAVRVYEVTDPVAPPGVARVEDFPGYHCTRDPAF